MVSDFAKLLCASNKSSKSATQEKLADVSARILNWRWLFLQKFFAQPEILIVILVGLKKLSLCAFYFLWRFLKPNISTDYSILTLLFSSVECEILEDEVSSLWSPHPHSSQLWALLWSVFRRRRNEYSLGDCRLNRTNDPSLLILFFLLLCPQKSMSFKALFYEH